MNSQILLAFLQNSTIYKIKQDLRKSKKFIYDLPQSRQNLPK